MQMGSYFSWTTGPQSLLFLVVVVVLLYRQYRHARIQNRKRANSTTFWTLPAAGRRHWNRETARAEHISLVPMLAIVDILAMLVETCRVQ